ncbi:hypothetical protein BpHYR1_031545 [Brachionus plicatilis]|uniref:Uncharacterized protein n=1 Tax=Brachionus plicatilis TaxID=10195 RepID=A0A3M7PXI0_BRAPC|nr:hypothetical protein BpHYR1_031545 [Brachionus plicatilis]
MLTSGNIFFLFSHVSFFDGIKACFFRAEQSPRRSLGNVVQRGELSAILTIILDKLVKLFIVNKSVPFIVYLELFV